MPKSLRHFFPLRLLTHTAWLLALIAPPPLCGQQAPPTAKTPSIRIWAHGGEEGVYLLYSQSKPQDPDFQIFFRPIAGEKFSTSRWHKGQPQAVAAGKYRLMVFFTNGACRSYDLVSAPRHERRLPENLTAVDCIWQRETIYVLARAQSSTTLPLMAESPQSGSSSASEDKIDRTPKNSAAPRKEAQIAASKQTTQNNKIPAVKSTPSVFSLAAGEYVILSREKTHPWQLLIKQPLPVNHWDKPHFAIHGDEIHLFGIERAQPDKTGPDGSLLHLYRTDESWTEAKILPVDNVIDYEVLEVNRQIRIVAFVRSSETTLPSNNLPVSSAPTHFRLGWPLQEGWNFTEPLQIAPGEILTASPDKIAFADLGQNLAVFEQRDSGQVHFSIYSSTGQLIQTAAHSLTAKEKDESLILTSLTVMLTLTITFLLIFWRRADAFTDTAPLPAFIQLAPLSRRLLAFLLDILPALLVTPTLFSEEFAELPGQLSFWEQLRVAWEDPLLMQLKIQLTFSALAAAYMMISELLFSATPGKLALRLVVLHRQGATITAKQAVLRNLLRLVELQFVIIAVLVLITKRRQRLGDLAARTIVVMQNPDLQKYLWQPKNLSTPSDESADQAGKSRDESSDPPEPPDEEKY